MVLDNRRLKVRKLLADMVGISKSAVHRILTENLYIRKLCTRVHPTTFEMKKQSKQCSEREESSRKKAKIVPSAGKVMVSVFWDARRIIFIYYLKKRKKIKKKIKNNGSDNFSSIIRLLATVTSWLSKLFLLIY